MTPRPDATLLTGATGLVGTHVIHRLLRTEPDRPLYVLVRSVGRWRRHARAWGIPLSRVTPVEGDLTRPGLGLGGATREALEARVQAVFHSAADTVFSRPLDEARGVNTRGTARVVELAGGCPGLDRFVHVSTAYVAGRMTGRVPERDNGSGHGFVNAYEKSKHEAETVVRASALPWVIVRPSSIVCDGPDGHVSQYNAVHRALRLCHTGLAPMMPGDASNPVDVVPAGYVARAAAALLRAGGVEGRTFHACSGDRTISLGEMLDRAWTVWSESTEWKRRAVSRPSLTDLETYRLFERSVEATGDARLTKITRSLSHFVPQLALPKRFDTTGMDGLTGRPAPPVGAYWPGLIRHLLHSGWAAEARRAA